jgi:hypothetical protein
MGTNLATKGRAVPRVVCCAIPISRAAGKVLVVTSRKRPHHWVCEYSPQNYSLHWVQAKPTFEEGGVLCLITTLQRVTRIKIHSDSFLFYIVAFSKNRVVPKGGWEPSDVQLEAAASREALEEGPPRCSSVRHLIS